jgi:hypothetical protein
MYVKIDRKKKVYRDCQNRHQTLAMGEINFFYFAYVSDFFGFDEGGEDFADKKVMQGFDVWGLWSESLEIYIRTRLATICYLCGSIAFLLLLLLIHPAGRAGGYKNSHRRGCL